MPDDRLIEALARLDRVSKVISKLDPEIKASAFELIKPLILDGTDTAQMGVRPPSQKPLNPKPPLDGEDTSDFELIRTFIAGKEGEQPSDNVYKIVAWLYSQYGTQLFPLSDIKRLADDAGVTIPARIDMTLKGMTKDAKPLVQNVSRGQYRVTVAGELFLKEKYGVTKGTRKRLQPTE